MFTYDDFVVYLLFYAMMYIILLRNANISSILVIFRDGFSFFVLVFSILKMCFFFYFCLYYFYPVIGKDDTLQHVMILFRYCENNQDSNYYGFNYYGF